MKTYGQDDVAQLNWFGLKTAVGKALAFRPVNALVQLAGRHVLPIRVANRLPLAKHRVSYFPEEGEPVYLLDTLSDIVARDIYWGGGRPTSAAEQRKLNCIEELSKQAATFLDIGAYSGVCALAAARVNPVLRAIAYEIVPENYFLLIRNIVENDLVERVGARLLGLGSGRGEVRVPIRLELASNPTSISIGSQFQSGIAIPVTTLDLESDGLEAPFLIKIDVEGFELEVFKGGQHFIRSHRPDIICEVLPEAGAVEEIEAMLTPLGYSFYVMTDEAIARRQTIQPDAVGRDWLFSVDTNIGSLVEGLNQKHPVPAKA